MILDSCLSAAATTGHRVDHEGPSDLPVQLADPHQAQPPHRRGVRRATVLRLHEQREVPHEGLISRSECISPATRRCCDASPATPRSPTSFSGTGAGSSLGVVLRQRGECAGLRNVEAGRHHELAGMESRITVGQGRTAQGSQSDGHADARPGDGPVRGTKRPARRGGGRALTLPILTPAVPGSPPARMTGARSGAVTALPRARRQQAARRRTAPIEPDPHVQAVRKCSGLCARAELEHRNGISPVSGSTCRVPSTPEVRSPSVRKTKAHTRKYQPLGAAT